MVRFRLFIFIVSFFTVANMAAQGKTDIDVHVAGYDGGWCKLIGLFGDQNYIVDSFLMNSSGHVKIQKDTLLHQGLYYLLLPDYKNISFLADNHQKFQISSRKDALIGRLESKNSLCNQLYFESIIIQNKIDSVQNVLKSGVIDQADANQKLSQFTEDRTKQLEKCFKSYPDNFYTIFKKAGQNPVFKEVKKPNGTIDTFAQLQLYRAAFWENVDFTDNRLLRTPVIANKLRRFIKELTPQNPDSIIVQADYIIQKSRISQDMFGFISNWIALQYQPTKTTVMDGEAVFVHVIDTYFDEKSATWFKPGELDKLKKKTSEMRASLLNRKGPNVVSNDPDGNKKSIYEITAPYIVVYMYAPNCEHCKAETPKLKAFYDEWKSKGVEVYAIAIETNYQEWKNYITSNDIASWINVFDPTNASIYAKYFVDVTPEVYVLNPERIIIGKNLHTEQIPVIIQKDMKKRK